MSFSATSLSIRLKPRRICLPPHEHLPFSLHISLSVCTVHSQSRDELEALLSLPARMLRFSQSTHPTPFFLSFTLPSLFFFLCCLLSLFVSFFLFRSLWPLSLFRLFASARREVAWRAQGRAVPRAPRGSSDVERAEGAECSALIEGPSSSAFLADNAMAPAKSSRTPAGQNKKKKKKDRQHQEQLHYYYYCYKHHPHFSFFLFGL